jgi:hypothetical protein
VEINCALRTLLFVACIFFFFLKKPYMPCNTKCIGTVDGIDRHGHIFPFAMIPGQKTAFTWGTLA